MCNVGELTETRRVVGSREAHDVSLMAHKPLGPICKAESIHLGAAVADFPLARDMGA